LYPNNVEDAFSTTGADKDSIYFITRSNRILERVLLLKIGVVIKTKYWYTVSEREVNAMPVRSMDFAGTWYPGRKDECIGTIEDFQKGLPSVSEQGGLSVYFGGIVPHAGWYFSGSTANAVFNTIHRRAVQDKRMPKLFFLFGMHLHAGSPNYIFIDEGFETPLGILKIHDEVLQRLSDAFDFIREDTYHYSPDNTIELQLPFIKYYFPDARVVTAGIAPNRTSIEIGEKAAELSDELGIDACFIGSTDLTHYGPNYGFTKHGTGKKSIQWVKEENDKRIIDAFISADPINVIEEALVSHNACCPGAAAAAIAGAKKRGAQSGTLVQYTTSYDKHPDSSFVGYAGVVYCRR